MCVCVCVCEREIENNIKNYNCMITDKFIGYKKEKEQRN